MHEATPTCAFSAHRSRPLAPLAPRRGPKVSTTTITSTITSKNPNVIARATSSSPQATALSNALNESEKAAMEAFRASGGDDARAKQLLVEAARTKKVDGDLLLGALAHLIDRGDAATGSDALTAADADGAWDLPWASVAPIKAWRYIPVPETFLVALGDKCALRSFVGPIAFEFSGAAGGWDSKNQAITFQFTRQKIGWGDATASPFVDKELSNKKGDRVYRFYGNEVFFFLTFFLTFFFFFKSFFLPHSRIFLPRSSFSVFSSFHKKKMNSFRQEKRRRRGAVERRAARAAEQGAVKKRKRRTRVCCCLLRLP